MSAHALANQLMEARDEKRLLKLQSQLQGVKLLIVDLCVARSYVELRAKYQLLMGI